MHSSVLTLEVRRLSSSASSEASEVISSRKPPQSTLATIARQREQHEQRPSRGGHEDPGRDPDPADRGLGHVTEAGRSRPLQDRLSGLAQHQVDELLPRSAFVAVVDGGDRVDVHADVDSGNSMPSTSSAAITSVT